MQKSLSSPRTQLRSPATKVPLLNVQAVHQKKESEDFKHSRVGSVPLVSTSPHMTMLSISQLPENNICADCSAKNPDWASLNLGILLCINCAGIHRGLGVDQSNVRSVKLDTNYSITQIEFVKSIGNLRAATWYEARVPYYYLTPRENDHEIVRENWIKAKYIRKEFLPEQKRTEDPQAMVTLSDPSTTEMPEPAVEGWLEKANKKGSYQKRWFSLIDCHLSYYKVPGDTTPIKTYNISDTKVTISDNADMKHRYTFEVTVPERIFILSADCIDDMFKWIHAFRRVKIFFRELQGRDYRKEEIPKKVLGYIDWTSGQTIGIMKREIGPFYSLQDRFYILNGPFLYFLKDKPKPSDDNIKYEGVIQLHHAELVDGLQKIGKANCLNIISKDMKMWHDAIRETVEKYANRKLVDFLTSPAKVIEEPAPLLQQQMLFTSSPRTQSPRQPPLPPPPPPPTTSPRSYPVLPGYTSGSPRTQQSPRTAQQYPTYPVKGYTPSSPRKQQNYPALPANWRNPSVSPRMHSKVPSVSSVPSQYISPPSSPRVRSFPLPPQPSS